jgi:hypothetical protein
LIKAAADFEENMLQLCDASGVKPITMDELMKGITCDTGNAIFDEVWMRDWE